MKKRKVERVWIIQTEIKGEKEIGEIIGGKEWQGMINKYLRWKERRDYLKEVGGKRKKESKKMEKEEFAREGIG